MSWSDFNSSCTKLSVYEIIGNYNNFSIRNEGMNKLLSNPIFISGIFWMNSYSDVTEHGLNTSSGHFKLLGRVIFHFVSEVDNDSELNFFIISGDFD